MNVETEPLVQPEYFPSLCGSCGRSGTVTLEKEIGQLCLPCATIWSQLSSMAFCTCARLFNRHSLSCTVRIRDQAS